MTDRDIEMKLKKAVEVHTPDVLDNILRKCDAQEGKVIYMTKNYGAEYSETEKN